MHSGSFSIELDLDLGLLDPSCFQVTFTIVSGGKEGVLYLLSAQTWEIRLQSDCAKLPEKNAATIRGL